MIINPPHRQHDMSVRIAITRIMKRPVSDHSFRNEIICHIASDTADLIFPIHFCRKSYLHFSCKLSIGSFLDFLHLVPEDLTIAVSLRRMLRQHDLIQDDTSFFCKIMNESGLFVPQLFTGAIGSRSHCGSPA